MAKREELASMIVGDEIDNQRLSYASETASAELDMIRIRQVRLTMFEVIDFKTATIAQLRRLAALDRYESGAMTKRRRASAKVWTG